MRKEGFGRKGRRQRRGPRRGFGVCKIEKNRQSLQKHLERPVPCKQGAADLKASPHEGFWPKPCAGGHPSAHVSRLAGGASAAIFSSLLCLAAGSELRHPRGIGVTDVTGARTDSCSASHAESRRRRTRPASRRAIGGSLHITGAERRGRCHGRVHGVIRTRRGSRVRYAAG